MKLTGRFTLPSEEHFADKTKELATLWGADAIRNSDGTHLDDAVLTLGKKIYSAYFPTRAHNEWISKHMNETPQVYLLSERILAMSASVNIPLMKTFYKEQLTPNHDVDPHQYWEVIDRTTGDTVDNANWTYNPIDETVHVAGTVPMHEYTASFLANIIWDPVEMYNHLTNNWGNKTHEIPFDIYHKATREFVFRTFQHWLEENPQVDVVRFTTFFYQFTLLFNQKHHEKIVDWLGYSCTVSPEALNDFENKYDYRIRPEDFVDAGCYNSSCRVPHKAQRDWLLFVSDFVRKNVKELVQMSHAAGKEAMMFLGDQWIGTEPYMDGFEQLGIDAVVGSIGDGTTTRMISDIPGVQYTEGRFLPYFFPDTFHEGNDPSIEGLDNWRKARRAILRSPIDRMGYGGYLSLAAKFPKFVDTVAHIAEEFREIHDKTQGHAAKGMLNVAVLNSWGRMRSWMAYTVAHALPNQQTYSYYGVLEALSGMRVNIRFISFNDIIEHDVDQDIDVIISGGPVDTAFSGGDVWDEPRLVERLRAWVHNGGAFVGIGEPSSLAHRGNRFFQLADVLGVDEERFQTLSIDRYWPEVAMNHFITTDMPTNGNDDFGEVIRNIYPMGENVTLLRAKDHQVQLAVNEYGTGRGIYISGLPYSATNTRLLERILFYASHHENEYKMYSSTNPNCEVAVFPETDWYCVINNTNSTQSTDITLPSGLKEHFELAQSAIVWRRVQSILTHTT